MLLAEDLLLLLTDDRTGKLAVASNRVDLALGGAQLVDLALARRVEVTEEGRLLVVDRAPVGDALLDEALALVDGKNGRRPKDVIAPLSHKLRAGLYARLAARGLVREDVGRILGIVPRHTWPAVDAEHEDALRAGIAAALRAGGTNEARTGALIALLQGLHTVAAVFDPGVVGMAKDELEASAERIAEGGWAADAVEAAIRQRLAAIVAATTSTTMAGAT